MKHWMHAHIHIWMALVALMTLGGISPCHAQITPTTGGGIIQLPDLTITASSSWQDEATGWTQLALTVKNRGEAASPACTLGVTYHTGRFSTLFGQTVEALLIKTSAVPALNAKQSVTVIVNVVMGAYPTGRWCECWVDSTRIVVEGSETNNTRNHYF